MPTTHAEPVSVRGQCNKTGCWGAMHMFKEGAVLRSHKSRGLALEIGFNVNVDACEGNDECQILLLKL